MNLSPSVRGPGTTKTNALRGTGGQSPIPAGPYTVYAAGGLFNQHELAANVLLKEAVARLSGARFQLVLPQSKETHALDAAYLRNLDLLEVVRADVVMARFDGLELDSGTVVEFTLAKSLGKPSLILRSDFRHLSGPGIEEPYNLMVKNWPRTVEVHVPSLLKYVALLAAERQALGAGASPQATMQAELNAVHKGLDGIAREILDGLEAAIRLPSPYPPHYRELVYQAARYSPGSGFDQVLTLQELGEIIRRLRRNGTL